MEYTVGHKVRVEACSSSGISRRGMISYVNHEDCTLDVIFSCLLPDIADEEHSVPLSRVHPLLDFELSSLPDYSTEEGSNSSNADLCKGYGNELFKLKDYQAAAELYQHSLSLILGQPLDSSNHSSHYSIGQSVLVSYAGTLNFRSGIISDVMDDGKDEACNKRLLDIILDGPNEESSTTEGAETLGPADEETAVPTDRVTPLARRLEDKKLQRALHMNLARCCLKRLQKGWAIKHASIAMAISEHLLVFSQQQAGDAAAQQQVRDLTKQLGDCLYFRGKVLLAACRPKFASMDCKLLRSLDASKATVLSKEIDTFRTQQCRSNRKLAKDIANWVGTAMEANSRGETTSRSFGGMTEDGDVGIEEEDDYDDENGVGEDNGEDTRQK